MGKTRKWQRIVLILVGVVACVYIGVALTSAFIVSKVLLPRIEEQSLKLHDLQPRILADLAYLDANPIFPERERIKDAQEFISVHIGWDGMTDPTPATDQPLSDLSADYKDLGISQLQKLAKDPRAEAIDVAWVDQLKDFDHWNIASHAHFKAEIERAKTLNGLGRVGVFSALPQPRTQLLLLAAMVRLIQLHKNGRSLDGLKLLRQASFLAQTMPSFVGTMYAIQGLKREHFAIEAFQIKNWVPIEIARIEVYKRIVWVWGGLLSDANWKGFSTQILPHLKPNSGVCAMASERILFGLFIDFFRPTVFLESDFSGLLKNSNEVSQSLQSVCSLQDYRIFFSPSSPDLNPLFSNAFTPFWWVTGMQDFFNINPVRIPFLRRVVGLTLLEIGTMDYARFYLDRMPSKNDEEK